MSMSLKARSIGFCQIAAVKKTSPSVLREYAPFASALISDIDVLEISVTKKRFLRWGWSWRLPKILGPFGVIWQNMN